MDKIVSLRTTIDNLKTEFDDTAQIVTILTYFHIEELIEIFHSRTVILQNMNLKNQFPKASKKFLKVAFGIQGSLAYKGGVKFKFWTNIRAII
jgi:hypothetical protein